MNSICIYDSKIPNLKGLENCPNLITLNAWGNNFHLIDDSDTSIKEISTKVLNTVGANYGGSGLRTFQSRSVDYNFCSMGYLPQTVEFCNEMSRLTELKFFKCYTQAVLPINLDLSRN